MDTMTVEALSPAALAATILELPHETRADITATESGRAWCRLDVSPMTDSVRAVFPLDSEGYRGDTNKRGQSGVMVWADASGRGALLTVIERARRMGRAS